MQSSSSTRRLHSTERALTTRRQLCAHLVAAACFLVLPFSAFAQQRSPLHPNVAPPQARPAQRPPANAGRPANNAQTARNQEHLSEWMSRHRDLPVPEQQRALEGEPGFHELPAQTQQRMRDRLSQLNNMPVQQRNRILQRNEVMENLAPNQRQQVRGAMLQLGSLPEDRRRAVARAFRDLREMPEAQRQQYVNSPAYRSQYNDQERTTINNLMTVEPYLPGKRPAEAPPQ